MRLIRLFKIQTIIFRYGLDEYLTEHQRLGLLARLIGKCCVWRDLSQPKAVRLRLALEALGPIFVKFGQMLSTRRDLLPLDIADELAKLQDQVPPFDAELAKAIIERNLEKPISQVFAQFDAQAVASASVAQVHFGVLHTGQAVAVKVLRPSIAKVIHSDLAILDTLAWLAEHTLADGKRLRPQEVVAEFRKHLTDELDLLLEASSAIQLRRNFAQSPLLQIPEVYLDYCSTEVMVMQRMHGTPIGQIDTLKQQGIDLPQLSRNGVEIFFTQVFRDGFFHADMHPGNILVAPNGQYIALDFGIMGTLTAEDKHYLAVNFLAFFERDYRRVAVAHVESGWAPANTRVDEFEAAIRAVCEPIFDKPLKDISFGKVLLRLFQTSRRFGIVIQPQLVLLQKTLLNIEGLGRQLDPELDLWKTAKPFLRRWMNEQVGWRAFIKQIKQEAPNWASLLPTLPRKLEQALNLPSQTVLLEGYTQLLREQKRRNFWLMVIALILTTTLILLAIKN